MAISNSKLETLKKAFNKQNAKRIAVVQQPSVQNGYIEIDYACSMNTLYYEVKKHPISNVMTLYLYPDPETMMHHIPKARVYQCVITDLALIHKIISRIHKVNRPLHNWGTPYYINVKPLDDRMHPTNSKLLYKIAELRDWACEMGYPLHEVLDDEYKYYEKSFKEFNS
jgi:hypothetical protein